MPRSTHTAPLILGLLVFVSAGVMEDHALGAEKQIPHIKKLYVDSLGMERGAIEMRKRMLHRLQQSREVQIVSDPTEADAVVKGTGRTWVTGHVSLSPHSNSVTEQMLEGFLSVELVDKNNKTLWSYLVIPRKFAWNGITDDLADQMTSKLLLALQSENQASSTALEDQVKGTLKGAGATFPAPLYQRWFELFEESHPNVQISYDAVGSEEGIKLFSDSNVDFGASEMPLSDSAISEAPRHAVQLPAVLGAVVLIYNVRGLRQTLNFTPQALAGIFLGRVRKWNDPLLKGTNHGASLPDVNINVVHRSDGSGTTYVLSDYLSKISTDWKSSVGSGTTLPWPVGTGAEHNEGVAAIVERTPNSIGYVELIYAIQHELSFGSVKNAEGQFIRPGISSMTAAAANAGIPSSDFRVSITNAPGKDSYPISTYTWMLLPERLEDEDKRKALAELIHWVLTSGQKDCSVLGYAPLPAEIAKRALESFDSRK